MCSLPSHEGQHVAIALLSASPELLDDLVEDLTPENTNEVMAALVAYGRLLLTFAPRGLLTDIALTMDSQPAVA